MKTTQILIFTLILFFTNSTFGQTKKTSFLIIQSTKNYNTALKKAQLACNKLGLTLNLNGNYQDTDGGLTNSEICGCGESHGYLPRGRYDDGNYISIEYSSDYSGFSKGYYIVIVSSGERETVNSILTKVQAHYKSAYIKDSDIYIGCMH
jgi:hypothetical protein